MPTTSHPHRPEGTAAGQEEKKTEHEKQPAGHAVTPEGYREEHKVSPPSEQEFKEEGQPMAPEGRPVERKAPGRTGLRGTAAMDAATRKEVARKGGLAVSRNRQHMAEIGRKGGQSVSQNREHMARIGRKGGAASRGHRGAQ